MFAPTMSVHKVGSRLLELLYKLPASRSRSFAVVVKNFISLYFVYDNSCVREFARVVERGEILLVQFELTAQKMLKLFKGTEG